MSDPTTNRPEAGTGSTTGTGAPAISDRNSLTVGANGPILLHDIHFLEQMAHFNRERIPERNVHAKGSGAFGTFETTNDVSEFTKAALFQPGAHTEMLARFSTVAGEQGSPDTWRDPRAAGAAGRRRVGMSRSVRDDRVANPGRRGNRPVGSPLRQSSGEGIP
jgi:catalase